MDRYQVPVPPEDTAMFSTLKPAVQGLRNSVDKVVSSREQYIDKFCRHLDRDITDVDKEVKDIKNDAQNPMILDPEADEGKVRSYVQELLTKLEVLKERSTTFKNYQKNFKVEVTKYEDLDDTYSEVKLKQLLWESQKEWKQMHEGWMKMDISSIQPDGMNGQVMKFAKSIHQLEKGLPPNFLVPKLKAKVEEMREKMPVIQDLCNPSLKQRHWLTVENILGHTFNPDEPKTLQLLEDIKAFEYVEEIQAVSGQASSEASLEGILKKVEDSWKTQEFPVLSHRESKDVFILGGTDDIQVLLDDSIVREMHT